MWHENSLSHRVVRGGTSRVDHLDSGKEFAVAIDSACANRRDGGAGYPKPGHRAGVVGFQTDSPAVERTISCPWFGRIEERRPAARPHPKYPGEKSAGSGGSHSAHDTTRRHSLEYPHNGQGAGAQPDGGSACLAVCRLAWSGLSSFHPDIFTLPLDPVRFMLLPHKHTLYLDRLKLSAL